MNLRANHLHIVSWIVCGLLAFATHEAQAIELYLGLGENYSALNSTVSGQSVYHSGLGYTGEARVGLGERRKSLVVEFFGFYESNSLTNNNTDLVETNKRTGFGGGVDFVMRYFFVGGFYERVSSDITTNGTLSAALKFPEYGARAGFVFPLSPRLSLTLGGLYGLGTTTFTSTTGSSVTSDTKDYRAFALFTFSLFSPGKSSPK